MKRYDPALTSTRVHILDLYRMKTSCLHSIFNLLCELLLCGLDTLPSSTQVVSPLDLH
ncbi:hypothetical protein BHE74_00011781 [Ensete ventricosum]|nr:hypothetical protein GW17_00022581 [Ensete ventricosum]RWW79928.1 hypothetical protein BHE74_00011781 [Ensete ventricosum]RZR78733.1 hypothetical protein BHM03_00004170 [Ensete ventricosum]